MKKKKKMSGIRIIIVLLFIALLAVLGLIIWKSCEYNSSEDFYDSLRGALRLGGIQV